MEHREASPGEVKMKLALCTLLIATGLVQASMSPAKEPARPPLLGRWAVDVSQLPMPAEARPRSVTIAFSDAGDKKWTTEVTIVDASGSTSTSRVTHPIDGTPTPVVGSDEADSTAVLVPRPDVLVMALSKGGVPGSVRVYTIGPDGNTSVETVVYAQGAGVQAIRTNRFTRIR
jgi:hypothetical protein